ncbi:LPS assembly lipoprotein LptE [Bosea sp. 2KB_26]|uniref:LPS assembly lipoprotein LptE n=1 Tax=Bosea sp. 2KB_26 TaxID=3237475 RepID=UPI0013B01B67
MSSSDSHRCQAGRGVPTRRLMLAAALAAAALAGGCLRPLYAENTTSTVGGSVKAALRNIEVPEIKGLVGHYLRNELVFELDGGGAGEATGPKRLKLQASVQESIQVVTVDYVSGRADSAVLVATATWSLVREGTGEVVSSGTTITRAPYERSQQRFSTVRAARDAQVRAGKSLATLIQGQIAADLVGG